MSRDLAFDVLQLSTRRIQAFTEEDMRNELMVVNRQGEAIDTFLETGDVDWLLDFTQWNLSQSATPQTLEEYLYIAEDNLEAYGLVLDW